MCLLYCRLVLETSVTIKDKSIFYCVAYIHYLTALIVQRKEKNSLDRSVVNTCGFRSFRRSPLTHVEIHYGSSETYEKHRINIAEMVFPCTSARKRDRKFAGRDKFKPAFRVTIRSSRPTPTVRRVFHNIINRIK